MASISEEAITFQTIILVSILSTETEPKAKSIIKEESGIKHKQIRIRLLSKAIKNLSSKEPTTNLS